MSVFEGPASYYLPTQATLSNALRMIWVDTISWTTALIYSILFGTGDQNVIKARVMRASEEFASLFGQFYGEEVAGRIRSLLERYTEDLVRMIHAYAQGDTAAISDLRRSMYAVADEFSRLLSQINPYWDRATLQIMLYEMINDAEDEIMRILAQQYEKSIEAHDRLLEQAYRISDELTYGLRRQFSM